MSKHYIKNIEIKNFKCFEDFKAEGFGRVNLIGGKNNVGKTAFMEACLLNAYTLSISTLIRGLNSLNYYRNRLEKDTHIATVETINKALDKIPKYYSKSNINTINYEIISNNGKKEYSFFINGDKNIINSNQFSYEMKRNKSVKYIDNHGYNNASLKEVYTSVQLNDVETRLSEFIVDFDKSIVNFKIIGGDQPQCKTSKGIYQELNEFGDGLKHWISIICSLYATKNGYLFIDEIDNGIHYTNLDKLWEIILTISKEQNVQVFATTHSKECIESYVRVAKKLEDEEITYSILSKLKSGKIHHSLYDNTLLKTALYQEHEVR